MRPDFCVSCEGQHDEMKHERPADQPSSTPLLAEVKRKYGHSMRERGDHDLLDAINRHLESSTPRSESHNHDGGERCVTSRCPAAPPQPAPLDVDALAQIIRQEDGNHDLGAGALAERIVARLSVYAEDS